MMHMFFVFRPQALITLDFLCLSMSLSTTPTEVNPALSLNTGIFNALMVALLDFSSILTLRTKDGGLDLFLM
jgi:hypothetical protein